MIDLFFLIKILTTIIFSITLCNLSNRIAKKLSVLDYPDQVRKLHKKPMPQTGGIIIYSSIILNFFFSKNYNYDLSYIVWISLFFILGFLDDKFNIHWTVKFIIPVIFITTFLSHNNHFIINEIYSDFFKNNLIIKNTYKLNFIFTILCIVLLLNAINMIDGHNGTCLIYFIFCILFLVFQNNNNLNEILIIILPSAIVTAYYNINNKLFIGNCGSFLISGIISYYLIKNNNYYEKISAEKIFLLLIIPGLDMLRLFISRIINKKNPFSSDRNHLHHLLLNSNKKYNLKYFFYFLIMFLPSILSLLKILSNFNLIIICTLFYVFIIIKLNKNYKIFFFKKK